MKARVDAALAWLRKHSQKSVRDGMLRYAIPSDRALGVRMNDIQKLGKQLGRDHALALALWKTGVYEARMLTAYVDEPACVTAAQMDAQARDFDNWAICDTLCFALWVQTPHAFAKIRKWAGRRDEFARTVIEKMLVYALGRGLEYYDMPTVRRIQRDAAASDYRWSSLIQSIVQSTPFQMRRSEP